MSIIEDQVCSDIQTRASLGLLKYGTTVERTDLSQNEWVQHSYEECLDMAIYLKRLQNESCSLSMDDKEFLVSVLEQCKKYQVYDNDDSYYNILDTVLNKLKDDLKMV